MGSPVNLFNADTERSVVGSVLIDPSSLRIVDLDGNHFYLEKNRIIWEIFKTLDQKGIAIDFQTVTDELKRIGKYDYIGGANYLLEAISNTVSTLNVESYASEIKDYAMRREILDIARRIASLALDTSRGIQEELHKNVYELSNLFQTPKGAIHWSKFLAALYDDIEKRISEPKEIWGIATGYKKFDQVTGGIQPGELMLFSGVPGIGKSLWVMQAAEQMAAAGYAGAIYSIEMPASQTLRRMVSYKASIPTRRLKSGQLEEKEHKKLLQAFEKLSVQPVYFSDAGQSTLSLRADLQRLKIRHGIQWFVFDYMFLASDGNGMTEVERTAMLSRQFKMICRDLDLAGIVIHSMRKTGLELQDKPGQEEMRGSSQVAYDSDLIVFLNNYIPHKGTNLPKEKTVNLRTITFGKGRELENPQKMIYMVKHPEYPFFGDFYGGETWNLS